MFTLTFLFMGMIGSESSDDLAGVAGLVILGFILDIIFFFRC